MGAQRREEGEEDEGMDEQVASGEYAPVDGRDAGQDMWVPEGARGYEEEGKADDFGGGEGGGGDEPMGPGQATPQQANEEEMCDVWNDAEAEEAQEQEEELDRAAGLDAKGGGGGAKGAPGKEARARELGEGRGGKVNATIGKKVGGN